MLDPGVYQRALQQRQGNWPPQPGTMFSQDAPPQEAPAQYMMNQTDQQWPPIPGTVFQQQDQQQQQPDILQLLMMILGQ